MFTKRVSSLMILVLVLAAILSACAPATTEVPAAATEPPAAATEEPAAATEAPAAATEPPASEASFSQADCSAHSRKQI